MVCPRTSLCPHTTPREYTLKTQLLKIQMKGDESTEAYLNRAQEYVDALTAIGEPVKDKDLVMLVVSGLREEYNGLKSTITARQFPTAFTELHALLSDYDYMIGKTRASGQPVVSQVFTAATGNYGDSIGSSLAASTGLLQPSASHQQLAAQISSIASTLGYQLMPATTSGPQAFYGSRHNTYNRGNRHRGGSRGNN